MSFVLADRVKEPTTTTGTGSLTLGGAESGFLSFSAAVGNGNTTHYAIVHRTSAEWECGIGTVSAGALARTTVFASSNSNAAVNFSAGTKDVFVSQLGVRAIVKDHLPNLFDKSDPSSTAFIKTGAGTLSIKAGTSVMVADVLLSFASDSAITMPTLTAGTDYAIYACTDGSIRADANWSAPTGYTTANSRKIGGFHYGFVAAGTTVAGGSFATTGNGMIWTQTDVDNITGINLFSIWDLKFRPRADDPRGMALVNGTTWVDIYLCSTDTATNGTSKAGSNIASGTVLPKIPAAFGGNGTTTYPTLNWWVANELARANKKRLMWEHEFVDAAFGVTENQSIDATASTYPTTQRNAGYTSKYGIEQASGHHWTWGQDTGTQATAFEWSDVNGNNGAGTGRGQMYNNTNTRVILGGARTDGAYSGSRASGWSGYPWYSSWHIGVRAASDHMQLD